MSIEALLSEVRGPVAVRPYLKAAEFALLKETRPLSDVQPGTSGAKEACSHGKKDKVQHAIDDAKKILKGAHGQQHKGESGEIEELRKEIEALKIGNANLHKEIEELRNLVLKNNSAASMVTVRRPKNGKGTGKYERMPYKIDHVRPIEEYRTALEKFDKDVVVTREQGSCSVYPDPVLEEYFHAVALSGVSFFKWELIRGPFIWKLEKVLEDMVTVEEELKPQVFMEKRLSKEEMTELKNFILSKAQSFTYAPFTIQRLCELLALPTVHYRIAEKFYRAIEKNINIVMEVYDDGKRVTGVDEPCMTEIDDGTSSCCETDDHYEKTFLVCVDEMDKPLEEQRASLERDDRVESLDDDDEMGTSRLHYRHGHHPDRPETPPPQEDTFKNTNGEMSASKLEPLLAAIERAQEAAASESKMEVDEKE